MSQNLCRLCSKSDTGLLRLDHGNTPTRRRGKRQAVLFVGANDWNGSHRTRRCSSLSAYAENRHLWGDFAPQEWIMVQVIG
jgi:hypothetical protein